jgi:4-diphosphocytidyl-2-C-methyl-D-erythritol kinase
MQNNSQKAYAKINLGLDVLRRREDGYHEVRMIMQTVDICDDLILEKTTEPGICIRTDNEELPIGSDNLIYKAADLILQSYRNKMPGDRQQPQNEARKLQPPGVRITLTKRIPIAAGMAGGSADAAAALRGMNELFEMGYNMEELQQLGVKLGADIPYCLVGGTMLSEGIGEILSPLPAPPGAFLVVAKPDINVSTKYVYENLHADTLQEHPDIDGMMDALEKGSLQGIADRLGNVLETVTVKAYPVIAEIKELMKREGALNALMSGSGPTVFGIYTRQDQAEETAKKLQENKMAKQIFVTTFKR